MSILVCLGNTKTRIFFVHFCLTKNEPKTQEVSQEIICFTNTVTAAYRYMLYFLQAKTHLRWQHHYFLRSFMEF